MDFELNDVQKAVQRLAQEFARKEIVPRVDGWERGLEPFDWDLIPKMGALGFFGSTFPPKYGGTEMGFLSLALICEEITKAYFPLGFFFNMCGMTVPFTILNWGNEEQRGKYVPRLISGEWIGSFGLTEPGGGSDVLGGMKTRAVRDGDTYILNGSKMFNTLAHRAQVDIVFAKTDPDQGHRGVSAFLVDTDTPGFLRREIGMQTLGRFSWTAETAFEDCRAPRESLLGKEGEGFKIAMNALDYGRLTVACRAVALAQACLEASLIYAKEREAFGQEIGNFQLIKGLIADMVAEVDLARLGVYRSAYLKDKGQAATRETAIAKYFAGEVCGRASRAAAEIFGGYAYTDEFRLGMYLSNSQFMRTGEGSANILRLLIADDALGWKRADRHDIRRPFALESDL